MVLGDFSALVKQAGNHFLQGSPPARGWYKRAGEPRCQGSNSSTSSIRRNSGSRDLLGARNGKVSKELRYLNGFHTAFPERGCCGGVAVGDGQGAQLKRPVSRDLTSVFTSPAVGAGQDSHQLSPEATFQVCSCSSLLPFFFQNLRDSASFSSPNS